MKKGTVIFLRRYKVGKAIAIFNQKGGVGKTTTNINLAACLAMKGKKTLIIDIDPQGNTTSGVGISKKDLELTTHELLIEDDYHPEEAILPTGTKNLDIIPASVQLAGAEVELIKLAGRDKRLKRAIELFKTEIRLYFHRLSSVAGAPYNKFTYGSRFGSHSYTM